MKILFSKMGFKCGFCAKKRTGAYRIVDGAKSCEKCNRAYDYVPQDVTVPCPVCSGVGHFTRRV